MYRMFAKKHKSVILSFLLHPLFLFPFFFFLLLSSPSLQKHRPMLTKLSYTLSLFSLFSSPSPNNWWQQLKSTDCNSSTISQDHMAPNQLLSSLPTTLQSPIPPKPIPTTFSIFILSLFLSFSPQSGQPLPSPLCQLLPSPLPYFSLSFYFFFKILFTRPG